MDGGPFRGSRPADRGPVNRPQPIARQSEPSQSTAEHSTPHRVAPHYAAKEHKSLRRFLLPAGIAITVIVIAVLGVIGWLIWSKSQNSATAIDESKYQAIFLTSGQVYFGKLRAFNDDYMKLTDVFYLQQAQAKEEGDSKNPQEASTDQNSTTLVKLGVEIHAPEDEMIVSKDQLLFYENLKTDGKVAQSIEKYKQANK